MIDRFRARRSSRTSPRNLEASRRRRHARRPIFEALEGRRLLSTAGSPDFTYGLSDNPTTSVNGMAAMRGLAQVNFESPSSYPYPDILFNTISGEVLQSDGKLLVFGSVDIDDVHTGTQTDTAALARLDSDGSLDASFGSGGVVLLPVSTGFDQAGAVALEPDGQIVVATSHEDSEETTSQVVVYRLDTDGSIDTTFGAGGSTTLDFGAPYSQATTLAIGPDGSIVVGGAGSPGLDMGLFTPAIVRLEPDGAIDTTFGTDGEFRAIFADSTPDDFHSGIKEGVSGLAVQSDGSILFVSTVVPASAADYLSYSIAVGKLTPSGAFDSTFGTGGQVLLGSHDSASGLAVLSNGPMILSGSYAAPIASTSPEAFHLDVYRLNADGTIDTTFGTGGEATPDSTTGPQGFFPIENTAPYIATDGTIYLGGDAFVHYFQENRTAIGGAAVVALNADGTTDVQFGSDGTEILPTSYGYSVYGLAMQSDGQILASTPIGVARLLITGSTDDFDEDGTSDPAVLMPNFAAPIFAYRPSSGGNDVLEAFGTAGGGLTLPAPGAYDGSGIDELSVYLPQNGLFAIQQYSEYQYPIGGPSVEFIQIGTPGVGNSIPAPADYLGDGYTQAGVYEPATGSFVYTTENSSDPSSFVTIPFGTSGAGNSIPVPGDYDGSGHDEIAVYLPQLGAFAYRPYGTNGQDDQIIPFGSAGYGNSIPVPGDYDGSGHTELAVYLPALGAFAYRPYGTDGSEDQIIPFGIPGAGQSIPVPRDYDGSGHTELAVYIPSLRILAYRPYGTDGPDKYIAIGQPGAGNSYPFNSAGTLQILSDASGGGGGGTPSVKAAAAGGLDGYVDFVPDIAGQAKKKDSGSSSTPTQS